VTRVRDPARLNRAARAVRWLAAALGGLALTVTAEADARAGHGWPERALAVQAGGPAAACTGA